LLKTSKNTIFAFQTRILVIHPGFDVPMGLLFFGRLTMDTHRGLFLNGSRTPPQRSCVSRNLYRVWGTKRRSKVQPRIGQWRPMVWSGRDRIALPCGGSIPPPYLGGYPPTPRVRGQTPPRYTPVPIFHRATMTFLSSIALGGDTPPAWVPIPPLFRGGEGGV
jgi:hypothetical protein